MAILNFQFTPEAGYGGVYRAIAYTSAAPAVPVAQQDFNAPHPNPVVGALNVPTFEEHIVKIFARACNDKLVGQIVLTPPISTCQPPTNIVFSSITANSFTSTWTAPPSTPSNGYDWILYEVVGVTDTQVQSGNTANTSLNFSGLNPGTHYKLRVKSNCGASTSNVLIGETDTTIVQPVIFRNSMNTGNVTGIFIDSGSNILPSNILPGADYNYTGITTGTHSIEATLSGVTIGTLLEARQIRGVTVIQSGQFSYPGGQFQLIASAGFLPGDIFEILNVSNMYTQNNGDFKVIVPPLTASFGAIMNNIEFIQGATTLNHPSYNAMTDYNPDINCNLTNEWNYGQFLATTFGTNGTAPTPSLITVRVYLTGNTACLTGPNPPRLMAVDSLGVVHTIPITGGNLGSFVDIINYAVDKIDGSADVLNYVTLEETP